MENEMSEYQIKRQEKVDALPNIVGHGGRKENTYKLLPKGSPRSFFTDYYTAFQTSKRKLTKMKYDMCIQIGGADYCINADGTLVNGYNNFSQEEFKKAYDFFTEVNG
jgi:hypothetical protein